jgi:Protein of unknown function (DUF1064)
VNRRSKYGARRTTVDGITFASQREAARYRELKLLVLARKIFRLILQPRYRLVAFAPAWREREAIELGHYVADFRYCNHAGCLCAWGCTVEDVKGFKTPLYRWKKKHVEAQYGIQVREV